MNEINDLDSNSAIEQRGKSPAGGGDYTTERNGRDEDKESQLFQRLLVIVKKITQNFYSKEVIFKAMHLFSL